MVTLTRTVLTLLLLSIVLPTAVSSFFLLRKLSSGSSSYHDNPSISPLNMMNSNAAILRLTSRHIPDLPESFSPSAKRFSFSGNPYEAMVGRLPHYYYTH
ncbi:unnamed protein product [Cylicocyclus nassatus]|uniref:Uncharacterized protein n=1 Tax=Cylicocyclus nassatus TaxID=53992 RepID=A0AA36MEF9_CYLNA|nr:unnamed protein product [Cylicocyclus nassatus]